MTGLRELVEAVRPHLDELRERSEQAHYGYCVVENPHDFTPDIETNTPEEMANHRAACEAWDRGERDGVTPLGCGNLPRMDGWGLGGQTLRDPAASAAVALIEAITPDVLAAVEARPDAMDALAAVRRLGEARASSRAAWAVHADEKNGRSLAVACDAQKLMTDAHEALGQLADRLAARKEGGE